MSGREPCKAAIFGCAGHQLTEAERRFFREADPLGFILFQRNCRDPEQVRALTAALRECVGRADAPVLIDQEGGRVARLRPPHWVALPAAGRIGALHRDDPEQGSEAAWLAGRLMAADLAPLGISVNCAPVLDVLAAGSHRDAIGDRAYGDDPARVAALGRACMDGLLAGGVLPVVKHVPGHGRAAADSHFSLPVVDARADGLAATDFAPFRALADAPIAMTAHVLYAAIDAERPATLSAGLIAGVIRRDIGFDGLLLSDDLSMQALGGPLGERAAAALAAGCDVALHCNGRMDEMEAVAAATGPLTAAAQRRWAAARDRLHAPEPFDREAGLARLATLLGSGWA